jgi:hypothetical protein
MLVGWVVGRKKDRKVKSELNRKMLKFSKNLKRKEMSRKSCVARKLERPLLVLLQMMMPEAATFTLSQSVT